MRRTLLERLLRKQGRVNASVHYGGASFAGESTHLVSSQRIARMHADSNDIARLDCLGIELFQRFIY
jgi:hypothetical protein